MKTSLWPLLWLAAACSLTDSELDPDGDGLGDAILGAYRESDNGSSSGTVYLFSGW